MSSHCNHDNSAKDEWNHCPDCAEERKKDMRIKSLEREVRNQLKLLKVQGVWTLQTRIDLLKESLRLLTESYEDLLWAHTESKPTLTDDEDYFRAKDLLKEMEEA